MPKGFWRNKVIQPALDHDVKDAIREQQAILEQDSKNSRAHFALGTLSQFKGEDETAVEFFLRAIELDETYAEPHVSLGRIYAVQGRYDLAWTHAREAERLGNRELVDLLLRYPKVNSW